MQAEAQVKQKLRGQDWKADKAGKEPRGDKVHTNTGGATPISAPKLLNSP